MHNRSHENLTIYKQHKNMLTEILRKTKIMYYEQEFTAHKNDGKATWKLINEAINKRKSKNKNEELPKTFVGDAGETYTGSGIAEGFNKFFVSIGQQLEKKIPPSDGSPLDFIDQPENESNSIPCTNSDEIELIIKSLNPVGGGIDKISSKILLWTYQNILHHLTFFFNLCLKTGVFPDKLKIAVICPVHKSGDKIYLQTIVPYLCYPFFQNFWKLCFILIYCFM